jgi:hypothetical protein
MHARRVPGAHVLLDKTATDKCLEFAANIAAFYSDGRNERRVPVTVTYAKHISKPRNAPLGAVKLREEMKVIMGSPDKVPEELKQAREKSGLVFDASGSEEYRTADKAKRRKRTQAQDSKKRAKRI